MITLESHTLFIEIILCKQFPYYSLEPIYKPYQKAHLVACTQTFSFLPKVVI